MEKTKLGVSVFLMAALCCFLGMFAGYVLTGVLVGYILLREEHIWLRRFSATILGLMVVFSLAFFAVELLPNLLSLVTTELLTAVGAPVTYDLYNFTNGFANFFGWLSSILSFCKSALFVALGILTLVGKPFQIPVISKLVAKHIN